MSCVFTSLVPQMKGTREHFIQTTIRSDRSTEHTGDNVEVKVKGQDDGWVETAQRWKS